MEQVGSRPASCTRCAGAFIAAEIDGIPDFLSIPGHLLSAGGGASRIDVPIRTVRAASEAEQGIGAAGIGIAAMKLCTALIGDALAASASRIIGVRACSCGTAPYQDPTKPSHEQRSPPEGKPLWLKGG